MKFYLFSHFFSRFSLEFYLFFAGCILFVIAVIMLATKKYFKTETSEKLFENVYSWVATGWTVLIIASFIMFFFVQAFKIPSGSMRNTLLEGDRLFVNKLIYGFKIPFTSEGRRYTPFRNVSRGDIVVFQCPPEALTISEREKGITKDFIKRCVAVAGDKVEIKDKELFVNDVCIRDPRAVFNDSTVRQSFDLFASNKDYQEYWEKGRFTSIPAVRDNFGPVIVPKGHYMMMGDNRDFSFDSRFWGPLPDKYVKGKALLLYWRRII
ncbi:MAG: signal peptidase I [Endomicrobium sp.]|uniref:signal peptidase I n=1 Tax=Candidatus Endomicrobiellum pyrsonymphae TaxID=1408203 RepID=UPI003588D5C4|nr:signal peptidase I [Endomicrobium sp.]